MTEHDMAVRFDRALDGELGIALNGSEPLLDTAETVQALYDGQLSVPSEEFVMQLEHSLFPVSVGLNESHAASGMPESRPQPMARPGRMTPDAHGVSRSRLIAIAAVLVLLLGGMGAILGGPLDLRSDPEPSSIPAASFGTAESSQEPTAQSSTAWKLDAPEGTTGQMLIPSDGEQEVFRVIYRQEGFPIVQAVDAETGGELWTAELDGWIGVSSVTAEMLAFVVGVEPSSAVSNILVALDRATGAEQWREPLAALPVDMVSAGELVLTLDTNNVITALDPVGQSQSWRADLSPYVDDSNRSPQLVYLDSRLALRDGVLAAVTDRGEVVAVDSDGGAFLWKVVPQLAGPTKLQVVDGTFVVSNSDQGGNTSARSVPVDATPQAESEPAIGICQQAFRPVDIGKVPAGDGTVDIVDLLSIDPASGSLLWGVSSPARPLVWKLSEETLLGIATSNEQGSVNRVAYCLIDGASGEMSERDQLQPDFSYRDSGSETIYGSVVMPDGAQWTFDVDPELAHALPFVNTVPHGALKLGSMIVIAAQDGTIIGLPEGQSDSNSATPSVLRPEDVVRAIA